MSATAARLIGGFGRTLVTAGSLILLFTAFQLWGTGVAEARAQGELDAQFEASLQAIGRVSEPVEVADDGDLPLPSPADTLPAIDPEDLPGFGDAAGRIVIPAIDVNKTIVQGVARDDLRKGPGHYPTTPFPGQPGNAAIAGHRTTNGAPFFDLDQLSPGDEIFVDTLQGRFTYVVEAHQNASGAEVGHFIVNPTGTHVLNDQGDNRLTLTACHPKYSAAQRIIVTATLTSTPAPATPIPLEIDNRPSTDASDGADGNDNPVLETSPPSLAADDGSSEALADDADGESAADITETVPAATVDDSLGWRPEFVTPTAIWAAITALVALAAWAIGRRWRKRPTYVMAVIPVAVCLFVCFSNLDKLLPAV